MCLCARSADVPETALVPGQLVSVVSTEQGSKGMKWAYAAQEELNTFICTVFEESNIRERRLPSGRSPSHLSTSHASWTGRVPNGGTPLYVVLALISIRSGDCVWIRGLWGLLDTWGKAAVPELRSAHS